MKFYLSFFITILLMGCVCETERPYLLDSTNIVDMTDKDFDLSAEVKNWDYVVLEQNDSCRLSNISRLKIVGDEIFVVSVEAMKSDIYRFSIDGKFLNKIGRQGYDYNFVTNIVVDTFNHRVCLLDIIDRAVYFCDYDGKCAYGKASCPWVGKVMDADFLSAGELVGYYGFTADSQVGFFRADSSFLMLDTLSVYPVSCDFKGVLNFSEHATDSYDGNVLLIKPFSDTLFHYRNAVLEPAFITKAASSVPADFAISGYMDCIWLKEKLEGEEYYSKTSVFETGTHLWIGYGPNRLMFDKRTEKGVYFKDKIFYHSDIFPPLNFVERYEELLVCHVGAKEIQSLQEGMTNCNVSAQGKLNELFLHGNDGLQVLMFYEFR